MNKNIYIILIVISVVGAGLFFYKNSAKPSMPANQDTVATAEPAPNTITISKYAFGPKTISVKKGTTVRWVNMDIAKHTVTADIPSTGAPDGPLFGKGESYSFTFNTVGTFPYHCEPHPYMKATVTVTE